MTARLPAASRPWPCVVLAIDPGRTSGVCVAVGDSYDACASKSAEHSATVARYAVDESTLRGLPLVVVAEKWTAGWRSDRASARTVAGLGAAWGRWEAALDYAGITRSRVVRVGTSTWRARVLGGPSRRTTAAWKAAAQLRATSVLGHDPGPDASEALCIALWAQRAGEVGLALPAATLREHLAGPADARLLAELERRRGLRRTR